ncbi:MAG: hypothetical protein ACRYF2_05130, partial [Janthinobacterium lividum]
MKGGVEKVQDKVPPPRAPNRVASQRVLRPALVPRPAHTQVGAAAATALVAVVLVVALAAAQAEAAGVARGAVVEAVVEAVVAVAV